MHGELDRQTVLANRAEPARDPRHSSLPHLVSAPAPAGLAEAAERTVLTAVVPDERAPETAAELAAWGFRLIQILFTQGLIELGAGPDLDEICHQLSGHLKVHGDEAEYSLETAAWLVHELGSIRGIARLFATGGDLQLALRRARYPE
jgi:hypothetical protein